MTLAELKVALEGVNNNAFKDKVAYRAFPVGAAPSLPFICYMEMESDNFIADCKVYHKAAIETMLDSNLLVWDKAEYYIEDEDVVQVVYGVQI